MLRCLGLLLTCSCLLSQTAVTAQDIAVVLDVSGQWFLRSNPSQKLLKGQALPSGAVLFSTKEAEPAASEISIYLMNGRTEHQKCPPYQDVFLPASLTDPPALGTRFWNAFRHFFGTHPEQYGVTIASLGYDKFLVPTADDPTLYDPAGLIGQHVFLRVRPGERTDIFAGRTRTGPSDPEAIGGVRSWEGPAAGAVPTVYQHGIGGGATYPPASAGKTGPVDGTKYLWTQHHLYALRNTDMGQSYRFQTSLSKYFNPNFTSSKTLHEAVLQSIKGQVELSDLLGDQQLGGLAVAFRSLQNDEASRPDVIFAWPKNDGTPRRVSLPPGLYRATLFDLASIQPLGGDAWVIVSESEYQKMKADYNDAITLTKNWPAGLDASVVRSFLRVFMQHLAESH